MNRLFKSLGVIALAVITLSSCQKQKAETPMNKVTAIDTSNFDKTVNPGDNFFDYVNGSWIKNNPIPEDKSRWGSFDILQENSITALKSIFDSAATDTKAPAGSNFKKIGDFFASGMDTTKIEKDGIAPIKPMLDQIDNMKTKEDFMTIIIDQTNDGTYPLFGIYGGQDDKNSLAVITNLYQGGLSLPDRDYYLKDDENSKKIRAAYITHLNNMFKLLGETPDQAAKSAESIMKIETALAKVSRTRVELRDPVKNYNKMTLDQVKKDCSEFNWDVYFTGIGLSNPGDINVGQPDFFAGMNKVFKETKMDDWKPYLKHNLVTSVAPYLSSAFVDENFSFYGKVLSGTKQQEDRWKRVLKTTSGELGEAVGQIYVEKYFPPEAKERMKNLVNNLKLALKDRIQNLKWMSDETKGKALHKLEKMGVKIGYPDKWRDYSGLNITRDSYVMNVLNSNKFNFAYNMNQIGKPVDRGEWHMTPQTVNAYYNPNMNEIVFPAAILQPPFFNKDADDAVNYGGIGVVIGHEMTHGFDDQGRQYDADGNLTDWWTPEDAEKYKTNVEPLVVQYSKFNPIDTMHVNGNLTLGENIADFGGLTVSLAALRKADGNDLDKPLIDGFTPLQRYFLSYAQIWRQNVRDEEAKRRLLTDPHSPAKYRVLGGVVNVPEFYKAFNVTSQNKMFMPADQRAIIW